MVDNNKEVIWVKVSPELKSWCHQEARKEERSLSNWVARRLAWYRELIEAEPEIAKEVFPKHKS